MGKSTRAGGDVPSWPRLRGLGHGRAIRRVLAKGGTGIAQRINDAVGAWPGVHVTPAFGRWGYFVGAQLFGCFPLREKDSDLWVRLPAAVQERALKNPRVRPHRR